MDNCRQNRIRKLVRGLNKARHTQAKKVDILCNDIIPAHDNFIKHLNSFRFMTDFYEAIIGINNLERMLEIAGEKICSDVSDLNLAIILTGPEQLVSYHSSTSTIDIESHELIGCITDKLIKNICLSNKVCTLNDMCQMGLTANPAMLKKVSVAAIPLSIIGPSLGIMLLYRPAENPLHREELIQVASITTGLGKAIMFYRKQTQKNSFNLNI